MRMGRAGFALAGGCVLLAALALPGCSGKRGPTNPPGGSGAADTPFESGNMSSPATFVHTFPVEGVVGYHCRFHGNMGMRGTVTDVAGGADSAEVTASGMQFSPSAVSIRPDGFVRWRVTGGTHSVTSN